MNNPNAAANLTPFTKETAKAAGSKGGRKRGQRLSPERRTEIATIAAFIRIGKEAGWDPYTRNASDLQRVEEKLAKIAAVEAKAWAQGNDDRVLRAITASLQWERLRMWIVNDAGRKGGPALDLEEKSIQDEAAQRLRESRARRAAALAQDDEETVIDEGAEP